MDRVAAEALGAFEMVRDRSGLAGRPARELVGQARFRMMEQGFREVCAAHGAVSLEGETLPESDLKFFQPFQRFGQPGEGIIFALASMPEPSKLPHVNRSRSAGVTLNYLLTPRFDFDGTAPQQGDVFVLFLVARDPKHGGKIEEIAVGVIDAAYNHYVIYLKAEEMLAAFADGAADKQAEVVATPTLKATPRTFVAPETAEPQVSLKAPKSQR